MTNGANTTSPQERDLVTQLTLEYFDVLNGSSDHLPPLDALGDGLRQLVRRRGEASTASSTMSCSRR